MTGPHWLRLERLGRGGARESVCDEALVQKPFECNPAETQRACLNTLRGLPLLESLYYSQEGGLENTYVR